MLWVCYCVTLGCLVDLAAMLLLLCTVGFLLDRAAMFWVCYCVQVGCVVEFAAIL
jgi:hypothetical protein